MKVNPNIFKAYDIRGVYGKDFDENLCYSIAQAYVKIIKPKGKIVVGMDVRLSSPKIKAEIIKGLTDAGIDVLDIGLVSTEMLYFTIGHYNLAGGILVTASHNPKEWNGLKLVKEKVRPIHKNNGIDKIKKEILSGWKKIKKLKKGKIEKKDVLSNFCRFAGKFLDKKNSYLKIVHNPNFGYEGIVLEKFVKLHGLNWNLIGLNNEPNGNFPKGRPDPFLPENRPEFIDLVKKEKADLGVAWDADADRVFFCADDGAFVEPYFLNQLLIKSILKNKPGQTIVYDPRYTWGLIDAAESEDCKAVLERVGHSFIKERMRKENAVFSGESSGHTYFQDFWYADTGLLPLIFLVNLLVLEKAKLSELISPLFKKYFISGEINLKVENSAKIIKKVEKKYKDGKKNKIDGLSIEYEDWRFNIRESNTEPLFRINLEAKSKKLVEQKKEEIIKTIKGLKQKTS